MIAFGFLDGFVFNAFLLMLLAGYGLYRSARFVISEPQKTLVWVKILHGYFTKQ